jgi:hypothetical protein
VLGEYIVRTHRHTQRRPLFIVDSVVETAGLPPENGRPGERFVVPSRAAAPVGAEA